MCFSDDNKYYIFHSLIKAMNGLSDEEKIKKYEDIQEEVRQRLKASYLKCTNKIKFYEEAFEILALYEADYLILNLFYENDSITIINYLYQKKLSENLKLKKLDLISNKYFLHVVYISNHKKMFRNEDEGLFLKSAFSSIVEEISPGDWSWKPEFENSNPIIAKYSKWALYNLKSEVNLERVLQSFILFVKIWNCFDEFKRTFNRKAILFYSYIISEYEKKLIAKEMVILYSFIYTLEGIFSHLFVDIEYIPLLDTKDSINYKSGYIARRKEFNDKIKRAERIFSISKVNSIFGLFEIIKETEEEAIIERAQFVLKQKLENYELPSYQALIEINKLHLNNENAQEVRKYLYEKLYLFEFI